MRAFRNLVAGALVLLALSPAGFAGIGDTIFQLTICDDQGLCIGIHQVPSEGTWTGTHWEWYLTQQVPVYQIGQPGNLLATLQPYDPESGEGTHAVVLPAGAGRSYPQVNLGFAMQAGSSTTHFTVKSALLTFAPMVNPDGYAAAAVNVSDSSGIDGATLLGKSGTGNQFAYLAQYNGYVPGGATFNEQITSIVAPPFGSASGGTTYGWFPVPGTVSNMSTQFDFTLTPYDSASGTSSFQLIPEPCSLLLLAVCAVLRRR